MGKQQIAHIFLSLVPRYQIGLMRWLWSNAELFRKMAVVPDLSWAQIVLTEPTSLTPLSKYHFMPL